MRVSSMDSKDDGIGYSSVAPWWWWEAQPSTCTEIHHHDHHRHHSGFVGLAYLCWLLFALAVYALPFFAGVTAGLPPITAVRADRAIIVGAIAAASPHCRADRLRDLRSPLIRAAIALLFALPAAVAGYHAALGLAHIGIPAESWRQAMAVAGAIVVAATAWARMALSARPMPDRALPPA